MPENPSSPRVKLKHGNGSKPKDQAKLDDSPKEKGVSEKRNSPKTPHAASSPSSHTGSKPDPNNNPDWPADPRAFKCVLCRQWHVSRCPLLRNY